MIRPIALRLRFWLWRLGLLIGMISVISSSVYAQDDTLPVTLIAEAATHQPDHVAILFVLQRRAARAGVSVDTMARMYSAVWKRRRVPLRVFDTMRQYPLKYLRILETIHRFSAGKIADPCPRAVHWGAPTGIDLRRARRAGWREVSCGKTRNKFWALR